MVVLACLGLFVQSACSSLPARNPSPEAVRDVPASIVEVVSIGAQTVSSPDGTLAVMIDDSTEHALWSVTIDGSPVVQPGRLGLRFVEVPGFDRDLEIVAAETQSVNVPWEQPWGEQRMMQEHYNELLVTLAEQGTGRRLKVRFRAFDDGIGFRYEVPVLTPDGRISITDELTEFKVDENSRSWWIWAGNFNRYEYVYQSTPLQKVDRAHTPFTLQTPQGTYVTIHEAALVDYPATWLDQQRAGVLKTSLVPWSDGVRAKKEGAFSTPWRTVQIGRKATDLLNSDLILNLNEPNKLGDVSWVEPGRYVGIWWCMHLGKCTWGSGETHGATTVRAKEYIDFAAENGFSGVLIEGWNIGWDGDWYTNGEVFDFTKPYPDFDLEEITAYALEKGVRLIGHHETSGAVTNYEKQMGAAFDLFERVGVRQVKTGYVADAGGIQRIDETGIRRFEWHDGQFMSRHHLHVVEEAAKRKISINSHEPIKDTGLRRTYPNWISREGARGMEYNAWGFPDISPPEHETVLPWTRMMAGPMDFTPGIFDLAWDGLEADNRVRTTLTKQLALYVTIYSPIQMAADLPENYLKYPGAFEFIKRVPTDWEQSIAIAGEVGDYVAYARQERLGRDWYVGAVTDEEARTLDVALDFLEPGVTYTAKIWRDGDGADWETAPYDMVIETRDLTSADRLTLRLAPGGGAALWLTPAAATLSE
ncbi:MAG: glycoside hydrolase family 97 protein [Hyphomonas sp.]|nr:glycoside hydrolase family 97 protein [Hyphomonas sp.]MBU3919106.1 glycoside hydrolase family 97 protein [Alphaproteobacteria bacterium]MBU4062468.1 glycoside hydrolase family 97 protein [Alphaproteobacteria bacterium]MBU4163819.1 glycoside hydrolase family 97 protein [Alphaproteobacteria bacterium]